MDPDTQRAITIARENGFSPEENTNKLLAGLMELLGPVGSTGAIQAFYGATATDPGFSQFRSTTLGGTPGVVKATGGNLYFWSCTNLHNAAIWVKFYNTATPTPGTTQVAFRFQVPANGQVIDRNSFCPLPFPAAMSAIATTVAADTGTQTAPATLPAIELLYK